jgi:hypothetical protein
MKYWLARQDVEGTKAEGVDCFTAEKNTYSLCIERHGKQLSMPLASGWAKPRCVSLEEEYILWKEKSGLMTGEDSWIIIKEDPGDPLKKKLLMAIEELEKELAGA